MTPQITPDPRRGTAPRFRSLFMAGFECSSHRRRDGERLDLLRATGHDASARDDYGACAGLGIRTIRDGLRWHLIEPVPGVYDWSSWLPMIEAAAEAGVEVIWDLFHYGSPDHVDRGSEDLIHTFARFAAEAARVHRRVTGAPAFVVPVNEISFFTWAVRTGYFPAAGPDDAGWFKRHLVRAGLAAVSAMRAVDPEVRVVWAEPLIHVAPPSGSAEDAALAEQARQGQFEAYDMLLGRSTPELGGSDSAAEALGLNFYPENQWFRGGSTIPLGHPDYRPLSDMLVEAHARYGKPLFLAETGAHGSARAAWLHYVSGEVRAAVARGVPVDGICIYPATAYPLWDDGREAHVGLLTAPGRAGRSIVAPVAEEIRRQQALFEAHPPLPRRP